MAVPAIPLTLEITTVGELLQWSYAILAMAHSAITSKAGKYETRHSMARSRLHKGLNDQTMNIGPLAADERLKMILPQGCCYCGSREYLSGANTGDNLVWACRSCNSSKCAHDALEWLAAKNEFPPILLLRRYLKLAVEMSRERNVMSVNLNAPPDVPFAFAAIPKAYPPPSQLKLWIVPADPALSTTI